ncbi:MAG TPA: pitrilysin family protein [Steroidobacteraceae bacterium]|nr:pitrilysin family protein [Steroidobacteraceae bacterium]
MSASVNTGSSPAAAAPASAAPAAVAPAHAAALSPPGTPASVAPTPFDAHCGNVKVPAHERLVLENGLTLIVVPRHDVPLVAFNAVLRGGECAGAPGKPGVASLVAGLLEKGAGARDAFEFVDAVENAGGTFHAGAGPESIAIRGQFLARDQRLMLELLADALLRPRFEAEELEILRTRHVELIKAAKDSDPSELIGTYGRAFLFGAHPYGRPVMGSERSLASITRADILDYYRKHFGSDRLTLVIAGDVDTVWLKNAVREYFAEWRPAGPLRALAPTRRLGERRVLVVDSPGSVQTHFWIGNVGVDRHYPQRAALDLVNTLYGGRFTSILNTELRVKSGLSYGARAGFVRGSVAGEFAIRSFAQTEQAGRAVELALGTLEHLRRLAVTPEMLNSARAYVLGQYPLEFETTADWAVALGELELYRLDRGYIENYGAQLREVTLEQMRAVMEAAYPDPAELAIVLIGDAQALRDPLRSLGPATVIPLTSTDFGAAAAT